MRNWVRLEFYPDGGRYHLIEEYNLYIDDDIVSWITDKIKEKWVSKLKVKINRLIIKESKYLLEGGTYILSGNICIDKLFYCRIFNAGSATINHANFATINHAGSATIKDAD